MITPTRNISLAHPLQQASANSGAQSIRFGEDMEKNPEQEEPKVKKQGFRAFMVNLLKKVWNYLRSRSDILIDGFFLTSICVIVLTI